MTIDFRDSTLSTALFAASLLLGVGCRGNSSAPDDSTTDDSDPTTSLEVALTMDAETDVSGFRSDIETCAGDDVVTSENDLVEMALPGGVSTFENAPFDTDSEHVFADNFELLDAGCYDVTATPITQGG